MITFNILGGSVSEGIFSRTKTGSKYKVNRYARAFSPLFCFDPGLHIEREEVDAINSPKLSKFDKQTVYLELSHSVFDFIQEEVSDYLIMDTSMFRIPYANFANGQYYVVDDSFVDFIKALAQEGLIPQIQGFVDPDFFNGDECKSRLVRYADWIKTLYDNDRIILINHRQSPLYWDKKKKVVEMYENYKERFGMGDVMMDYAFEVLKNEFAGCHIIHSLPNAMADRWHPLGLNPLHYTSSYYEYCLECVDVIVKDLLLGEETEALSKSREKWNRRYAQIYYKHVADYCMLLKEQQEMLLAGQNTSLS